MSLATTTTPWAGSLSSYIVPDVTIELVGLLQMRHHLRRVTRSPDAKQRVPAENPACQIEIGNSDNGIGMQVSQK